MGRTRIELPAKFRFTCRIPVRITDINYSGHVGNDRILSLIHEARVAYLDNLGFSELRFAGAGLIMADVAIEFKKELFYGDQLEVQVEAGNFGSAGFDLFYKLEKIVNESVVTVAHARTGMICYDYEKKKPVALPVMAREKMENAD